MGRHGRTGELVMILETSERRASESTESVLFVLWYSDLARVAQAVPNRCSWSSAPSPQRNQNDFRGSIRLDFPRVMSRTFPLTPESIQIPHPVTSDLGHPVTSTQMLVSRHSEVCVPQISTCAPTSGPLHS